MMKDQSRYTFEGVGIDTLIVSAFLLISLIVFGTLKENSDMNAGGMYGLFIVPAIPIIYMSVAMTYLIQSVVTGVWKIIAYLSPLSLGIISFWLNSGNALILWFVILCTIILIAIISGIRKLRDLN